MKKKKAMPWFKQYPSDFVAGVSGMSAEHIGVYSVLYNLMYARRRKLETKARRDDMAGLARVCGVSTRRFGQILADLMAMPNKITMDDQGRLSNPKFERLLAGYDDDAEDDGAEGQREQNGEHLNDIFEQKKRRKNSPKDDEKTPQNQATLFKNNDLDQLPPLPARARARPRSQILEKKECIAGGSDAAPTAAPEHTMDAESFSKWATASARTIPRGWSRPAALRRWEKLLPTPWQDLADAWALYIADNREKSKNSKFHQRTMYPENWFKDRKHESWLEAVTERREAEHHAHAAIAARQGQRVGTIAQWDTIAEGVAQKFATAIGEKKFGLFIGSTITLETDRTFTLDFHHRDTARSDAEQFHAPLLERTLGKRVRFTSDRKRTSAAPTTKASTKP